ncbi:anti-sigma factor [Roseisolibacter agri]|uniref:Regulator of SigK n=1 Tax=Roseisolibacter agri TaxID=2014610 RepID=A0AA37Q5N7_9BACT|nr:anti-sigma factor [Roseisolibacter agri]GLC25117.1 hypothetical protein rosag_16300 [Roseisolibacter agri]
MSASGDRPVAGDDPVGMHPEADLAAAYALGALAPAERGDFEAHLAGCAECRAEVRAMHETAALLARAVPAASPPPALRTRIVETARRDAAARRHPASAAPTPVVPLERRRRAGLLPWFAAAAALALAVGLGSAWRGERASRLGLERALADARARVGEGDALRGALAERDSLLAAVLDRDVRTAHLASTGAGPDVRVIWNRRRGLVVLTASALPQLPKGRTYQLWGIPQGGTPRSLGTFDAGPVGVTRALFRTGADAPLALAAITEEPTGGSPQPTSAPLLAGPLKGD